MAGLPGSSLGSRSRESLGRLVDLAALAIARRRRPRRSPGRCRGLAMLRHLDAQSRWHLRLFGRQLTLLVLISLPVLLLNNEDPAL
jgi:hypothetical protein